MNRTYWPGGLEADTEVVGLAELVIEGILIPVLAIPGVLGTPGLGIRSFANRSFAHLLISLISNERL